jgi:hypothetical protein
MHQLLDMPRTWRAQSLQMCARDCHPLAASRCPILPECSLAPHKILRHTRWRMDKEANLQVFDLMERLASIYPFLQSRYPIVQLRLQSLQIGHSMAEMQLRERTHHLPIAKQTVRNNIIVRDGGIEAEGTNVARNLPRGSFSVFPGLSRNRSVRRSFVALSLACSSSRFYQCVSLSDLHREQRHRPDQR